MAKGAAEALSFLGALAGARLASQVVCREGPTGRVFIEVRVAPEKAAMLARLAGAKAFTGLLLGEEGSNVEPVLGAPRCWVAVSPEGKPIPPQMLLPRWEKRTVLVTGRELERLDAGTWPVVELPALLEKTSLVPGRMAARPEVFVIVPPALARWALARSLALGIEVWLAPAVLSPLRGEGEGHGVVWMRLRAQRGLSPSWLSRLADLPGVIVVYAASAEGRLYIDARCPPPPHAPLWASMLPRGEACVLGASDVGHARLELSGELVDGASLVLPPAPPPAPMVFPGTASLPSPISVSLVPARSKGRIVAVLFDDTELGWARSFLVRLPASDQVYLVLGEHQHLLLSADETASRVPFGLPLVRKGPGALFVELGMEFFPALPRDARRRAFSVGENELVVLSRVGFFRFNADAMVPAWTTWLAEPPPMRAEPRGELSQTLAELERRVNEGSSRDRARMLEQLVEEDGEAFAARIRERAARALAFGRTAEAAQLYERIGELGTAARLYEQAARGEEG